jgi:hypothetical protein
MKHYGADVKVVRELLRHANSRITLDTYPQAVTSAKREAQSAVVQLLSTIPATKVDPCGSPQLPEVAANV